MLRSMRQGAKSPIMKVFLLFLAAGFALWGIGDMSGGFLSSGNKAIEAGEHSVSATEAATEFERTRITVGSGLSTGEALQAGLLNEVMGTLARQTLYIAEASELGVTSTREMQKTAISREFAFRDESGQFSDFKFRQILAQAGLSEPDFLLRLSKSLLQDQIEGSLITAGSFPTAFTERLSAFRLEQRTATLKEIAIADQVVTAPSDAELTSYFDKKQKKYDAPTLRSFDVIFLSPEQLEDRVALSDDELRAAFDLRKDEFVTPERRELRQMVFDTKEDASAALADLAAGKSFDDVAQDRLQLTPSDTNLGNVKRGDLTDELADLVFSAAVNTPAGPVETAFGFHLVLVDQIEPGSEASFEEIREQISSTLITEQAIDLVYDYANQLEDSLGTGASLSEAAVQLNIVVGKIENISSNGRDIDGNQVIESFGDLATDSLFLQLAWELALNTTSTVVETVNDSFFVVQPVAEVGSRSRSLNEIRDRVQADWVRERALAAAKAEAKAVMADADKFLANQPASISFQRSGSGLDHAAAGLIAQATFSQAVGDAKLIETGDSVIVVRTDSVKPAQQAEQADMSETMQSGLNRLVKADIASAFALALSESHQLELNPLLVQQVLIGQAGQ